MGIDFWTHKGRWKSSLPTNVGSRHGDPDPTPLIRKSGRSGNEKEEKTFGSVTNFVTITLSGRNGEGVCS